MMTAAEENRRTRNTTPTRHTNTPASRFSTHLPVKLTHGEDNKNPRDFPTRSLADLKPPQHAGNPALLDPKAPVTVTPLDLAHARDIVTARAHTWDGKDADGAPFDPTPVPTLVRDSIRKYSFTGTRLAYVSSETDDKPRWTEIEIYRTESGIFVAHRVAVTTVAHQAGCEILIRYNKKYSSGLDALGNDEFGPEARTPCDKCHPDIHTIMNTDPNALYCERDRHQVTISDYPESLIQALHTKKNGETTLGSLAASALQLAADRDIYLASVFYGTPVNP